MQINFRRLSEAHIRVSLVGTIALLLVKEQGLSIPTHAMPID